MSADPSKPPTPGVESKCPPKSYKASDEKNYNDDGSVVSTGVTSTSATLPSGKASSAHSGASGGGSLIPLDKINLKLIMVNGKTHEFLFTPSSSASQIAEFVFDNWPGHWSEEKVESGDVLRLIYHGRFLHGNVTLGALSLPTGKTTVMHLVSRETLPEPDSQDNPKKNKRGCCSRCCSIL